MLNMLIKNDTCSAYVTNYLKSRKSFILTASEINKLAAKCVLYHLSESYFTKSDRNSRWSHGRWQSFSCEI